MAEYDDGYRLRLWFDDGSIRSVDLQPHLGGEGFEPLRRMALFRTARVDRDLDTVVWNNGADMSPDFLYDIGVAERKVVEARAPYEPDTKR